MQHEAAPVSTLSFLQYADCVQSPGPQLPGKLLPLWCCTGHRQGLSLDTRTRRCSGLFTPIAELQRLWDGLLMPSGAWRILNSTSSACTASEDPQGYLLVSSGVALLKRLSCALSPGSRTWGSPCGFCLPTEAGHAPAWDWIPQAGLPSFFLPLNAAKLGHGAP